MGRGTTRMFDENGKHIGNRPKAYVWRANGQWYKLGGCCWTGWKRIPLTESGAMDILEHARQRMLNAGSDYGYGDYWHRVMKHRIASCKPSTVAYWARSLGVAV